MIEELNSPIGFYLHRAFTVLVKELNEELQRRGLNISHPEFSVLQRVRNKPGISQNELARELGKDGAAICRTLKLLTAKGYIHRTAISGCKNGVFLSESAEAMQDELEKAIASVTAKARNCVDAEDYQTCLRVLDSIYRRLK